MSERTGAYRSVSQLNQYKRCPQAYKLARIDKAWQRPAAWLPQGTAVHAVAEAYRKSQIGTIDPRCSSGAGLLAHVEGCECHASSTMTLEEAQELFRETYADDCNEYCEITPNLEFWSRSGPYGGAKDIERRFHIGLEQVEKFINWTEAHPEERIWIAPDGTPGIELSFEMELDGVPVRGFIDAIIEVEIEPGVWELRVRDYKTGNAPGDDLQLGVYALAISMMYDIPQPQLGDYYMAGKAGKPGKPTYPYNIGEWTKERVTEEFRWLEDNLEAGNFDPLPEPDKCQFCDVSASCSFAMA